MELRDLLADSEFPLRKRRPRQGSRIADAYRIMARAFADNPGVVPQHLVDAATSFCGADSAGISLEEGDEKGTAKVPLDSHFRQLRFILRWNDATFLQSLRDDVGL